MYQHKQTRENYNIKIEFINGYLTSIAKLKDKLSKYLSHTYFFEELPKNGQNLSDVVIKRITNLMDSFYKSNPTWTYDKELYEHQFQNGMNFQKPEKWKQDLGTNAKNWLSLNSEEHQINYPVKDCLIENFIELIEDFFNNENFKMYLMEGEILNELYHHWGGIGYQDFFFETKEKIYLLHFEYCD